MLVAIVAIVMAGAAPTAGASDAIGQVPAATPSTAALGGTELYGYLPYWQMSTGMADYLRGIALTSLELFSVTTNRNGTIRHSETGYKRITGAIGARLIAEAHARGQRVELVFSSFGFDRNAALFGIAPPPASDPRWHDSIDDLAAGRPSPASTLTARDLAALVARLGLDGVNVDVEQIAAPAYEGFSAFVSALRSRLDAIRPGLRLSVATQANRPGANLAGVAVSSGADRIFLMGYDFHWSASAAGASAPIVSRDGTLDLSSTIANYVNAGVPRTRIILGLPLYGMTWPVSAPTGNGATIGKGAVWIPSRHAAQLLAPGFTSWYDFEEVADYFVTQTSTGGWTATFYDTPRSLKPKLGLARSQGLAGAGFWALGYEQGLPGYADLMADFVAGRIGG